VDPTDGYYVPMSYEQRLEMRKRRTDANVIKAGNGHAADFKITPEWLKTERSDAQLAAALVSMQAKLSGGDFKVVGATDATLQAHINERADYAKSRHQFSKQLGKINDKLKELDEKILELQKGEKAPKAPAAEKAATPKQ
jgi:hypothetical protein